MFLKDKTNLYKPWQPQDWILLGLILVVFGFSLYAAPYIPDRVPVHWNIEGQPDGYGSKYINLFLLPGISLLILLLMSFLPLIDPFKKNYHSFAGIYSFLKLLLSVFFLILYSFIIYGTLMDDSLDWGRIFAFGFALFFGILGYILPRFKRNFFAGIRTPWTLVSDEVWGRTHWFGGCAFMATAFITFIFAVFSTKFAFIVFVVSILISVISAIIYSYIIYRKLEAGKRG